MCASLSGYLGGRGAGKGCTPPTLPPPQPSPQGGRAAQAAQTMSDEKHHVAGKSCPLPLVGRGQGRGQSPSARKNCMNSLKYSTGGAGLQPGTSRLPRPRTWRVSLGCESANSVRGQGRCGRRQTVPHNRRGAKFCGHPLWQTAGYQTNRCQWQGRLPGLGERCLGQQTRNVSGPRAGPQV